MQQYYTIYWAHIPSHTDMFTEGYIGITSKPLEDRVWQHKSAARQGVKRLFYDALRKYGEDVIFETILVCGREYAKLIENKLRPSPWIGWNIACGGSTGNADIRALKPLSKETRDKISKNHISKRHIFAEIAKKTHTGRKRSDETKLRISEALLGKTFSEERKQTLSDAQTGKVKWLCSRANKDLWSIADYLYNIWIINDKCGVKSLHEITSIPKYSLINIQKYFREGWNPLEDKDWLDFKLKYLKGNY